MQTLSSAKRTCMASASAVECTATVAIPISLQARWMRRAISPRLAMRTFSNTFVSWLFDNDERLAEFNRLRILHKDLGHGAALGRFNGVHHLHGFDDGERVARFHLGANGGEGFCAGLRRKINRAH